VEWLAWHGQFRMAMLRQLARVVVGGQRAHVRQALSPLPARMDVRTPPWTIWHQPCRTLSAVPDIKAEMKALMRRSRDKALTEAERAEAKGKLSVVKGINAGLKNAQIADTKGTPDDDLQLQVVQTMIKKSTQAADEFSAAGRGDLATDELQQVGWLREFLPPQMSPDELDALAAALVAEMGAGSPKDMGRVIGALKANVGSAASGGDVAAAVKRAITV